MSLLDSISGAAGGFNPDNLFGMFDSGIFAKIYFFIKIFFYFVLAVAIGITYYKLFYQYKILITVKSRLGGGGLEIKRDRAKIVVDSQNKTKLQLFRTRRGRQPVTCPIPPAIFKGKIGKKDHYELWLDDNFELHPISLPHVQSGHELELEILPQERNAWARYEQKALEEKYQKKDLLATYLPAGIMMMAMITAFLIWFFAAKQLGMGLSELAQQFQQVAASCVSMGVQ
jgi:hypothetical protein